MKYFILLFFMGCAVKAIKPRIKVCPVVFLHNKTDFPWNNHDAKTLDRVQNRCKVYYKELPCVSEFIKRGEKDYHVNCGVKQ